MFTVDGQLSLEIAIGGEYVPLDHGNLHYVRVIERADMLVPIFEISMVDVRAQFNKSIPITDATPVAIALGKREDVKNIPAMPFVTSTMPKHGPAADGHHVILTGVYDCLGYLYGVAERPYEGSSNDALKALAGNVSLDFSGTPTNDAQNWIPNRGEKNSHFAHSISGHGWVNNSSAMALAVNAQRVMLYKNLVDQIKAPAVARFYNTQADRGFKGPDFPLPSEYKVMAPSGVLNAGIGYTSSASEMTLAGKLDEVTKVKAERMEPNLNVSSDANAVVGKVAERYHGLNAGNTHVSYQAAAQQNKRLKALFNTFVDITVPWYTTIDLFDPVELSLANRATLGLNEIYSGKYILTGRVRVIQGTEYAERLVFGTNGIRGAAQGSLL